MLMFLICVSHELLLSFFELQWASTYLLTQPNMLLWKEQVPNMLLSFLCKVDVSSENMVA